MNDNDKYQSYQYHIIQIKEPDLQMKFIQTYSDLMSILQTLKAILIIFVDPSTLTPSQSLLKYYSFNPIAIQLQRNIFAYKGTEMKMFEAFNVLNYPQVTVIKDKPNNVLYNFIGCNQEKGWQSLGILALALNLPKPSRKLNPQYKLCPKEHALKLINQITETAYRNGLFMCNLCNMLSHVQIDKPILHCEICQYDICNNCSYVQSLN